MTSLAVAKAVREARRIRRNLVRVRANCKLAGDCGLASVLLAAAIGDPLSLRGVLNSWSAHVWNVVDGTIIDITATQFNDTDGPSERGVLVTEIPRDYHRGNVARGRRVLGYVTECWYLDDPYADVRITHATGILRYFLARWKRAMP